MRKLGKKLPRLDKRTLRLTDYLPTVLPTPPLTCDYYSQIGDWGELLNDAEGDCTCAAAGHMEMAWLKNAAGVQFKPFDADIQAAYIALSGYDPATGAHDDGATEIDLLNYWRNNGIADRKILAYAQTHLVDLACWMFGGAYIGIGLPRTAQNQDVWDVVSTSGDGEMYSWGGHAVPIVGYDESTYTVVTWGATKKMTRAFAKAYMDESYALISPDWLDNGKCPAGFDLQTLLDDLKEITV